jgi:hypothetical protein
MAMIKINDKMKAKRLRAATDTCKSNHKLQSTLLLLDESSSIIDEQGCWLSFEWILDDSMADKVADPAAAIAEKTAMKILKPKLFKKKKRKN